jgi:hypothetical protein
MISQYGWTVSVSRSWRTVVNTHDRAALSSHGGTGGLSVGGGRVPVTGGLSVGGALVAVTDGLPVGGVGGVLVVFLSGLSVGFDPGLSVVGLSDPVTGG